jgi:hypothetical protein
MVSFDVVISTAVFRVIQENELFGVDFVQRSGAVNHFLKFNSIDKFGIAGENPHDHVRKLVVLLALHTDCIFVIVNFEDP